MAYNVQLKLPDGWHSEVEVLQDESGVEITHFEASLPDKSGKRSNGMIDIYVGDMPEGESAEDQALANYVETVGFDDDDKENPIIKFKFNGRNAFGFDALCEDDSPMRFISQEVRGGVLAIICVASVTEEDLDKTVLEVEHNLRIK